MNLFYDVLVLQAIQIAVYQTSWLNANKDYAWFIYRFLYACLLFNQRVNIYIALVTIIIYS